MPMLCCYARRRRHRRRTTSDSKSPVDSQCRLQRNAMFSLMLARLDEFESLTPLMITPSVSSSASEIVTAARAPEYQLEAPQSSSRRPRLLSLPQLASQQSQDERPRHEEQSKFCSDSHRRQQLVNAEERDAIKHQVFVDNDNGVKSKSNAQLKYTQRRQQFVCRIDDSNQKNDSPASCIPLCTTSKSPHQILTTLNSKNPTAAANNQAIIIRSQSSAPVISTQRAAVRVLTSTAGGGGGGPGPGPGSGSASGGPSLGLGSFSSLSQTSPPPPRRTPTGKTLIVPLATNKGRAPLAPLLGTAAAAADGRLTSQSSLDNATSKSFTTIPEDDDELKYHSSSSSTDAAASNDGVLHTQTTLANRSTNRLYDSADLISIDRTSISCAESRPLHYNCLSGVSLPPSAPEFEIPVPSYAPPPPPAQTALSDPALYRPSLFIRSPKSISRREFLTMTAAAAATADSSNNSSSQMSGQTRTRKSPSGDSLNSFSSPADSSSYGTQSPLDTSGSLSDSFYLASENGEANTDLKLRLYLSDSGVQQRIGCDASTAAAPELELSAMDADAQSQRKYLLHRIEEESEHAEEILVKDNNDIGLANSRTFDSIASELSCIAHIDSERNILIPRSISQQFELLNEK